MASLELFYDFTCPYAFLASTQVEALAERADAQLVWRPMFLGGVFRALYGEAAIPRPPAAKIRNIKRDLQRWAQHWGVSCAYPEGHPQRSADALRAVLAAPEDAAAISHRVFAAYWRDGLDIGDRSVLTSLLQEAGVDAEAVLERVAGKAIRDQLRADTDEAVRRGVFGAPTFFIDGEHMVWGQDRLLFVEKLLGGWRPEGGAHV
jgi:2-hydroxychromene-2-carboxylate isomerase